MGASPKVQEPLPMWELRGGGVGVRTVRDRDNDLAHEFCLHRVRVLSVQHDVGGADLACGAVQTIELIGGLDAVHQGAVLPQIWVHSHHLPRKEQISYLVMLQSLAQAQAQGQAVGSLAQCRLCWEREVEGSQNTSVLKSGFSGIFSHQLATGKSLS